jgi:hypothetical protein
MTEQSLLAEKGCRLARAILGQRERCRIAPLNRSESALLLGLQREFAEWEQMAVELDIAAALEGLTDDLSLLRPPVEPIPRRPQLSIALANGRERPRKMRLTGLPSCGGELND